MRHEPPYPPVPRSASRRKRRRRERIPAAPARPMRSPQRQAARARRPICIAEIYRRRRKTLTALYATLALVCLIALFASPVTAIKSARLLGTQGLTSEEAEMTARAATPPSGANWLRAPVATLEERVKALPWVKSAQTVRRLPNIVETRIVPRQPVVLTKVDGVMYETDMEGVPIRKARRETVGFGAETLLPLIVLKRSRPALPGAPFHDAALAQSLQIALAARRDALLRIAKIEVDLSDNICLNMRDGIPIFLGQSEALPEKIALARRLYAREPNLAERLIAVNLSSPSQPACTPRVAAPLSPDVPDATEPPRAVQ